MRRGRFVATIFLLGSVAMTAPAHGQADERVAYASVLDQSGAPVPTLATTDVIVREDNVQREIIDVTPAADPMEIALLVDNSEAAEPYIRDYREALSAFITIIANDETRARHQVSVITLAERPTIHTNYTLDLDAAIKGVQRLFAVPGSATYLLDGIIETSQGIRRRTAVRPVIVAITTEGPEYSDRNYQAVIDPLIASGTAFHVVSIGAPTNQDYDRATVLTTGSKETGGRRDTILTSTALTSKLKQVAQELTHQFKITYVRPQTLIPPERVTVSAGRPGLTVRGTPARDVR
jgi:hypothetical protein